MKLDEAELAEAIALAKYYAPGCEELDTYRGNAVSLARALLALAEERARLVAELACAG